MEFVKFPSCCSITILHSLYGDIPIKELALMGEKQHPSGYYKLPVIFCDNDNQGRGKRWAKKIREEGFRVDEVNLGDAAHGGHMRLWVWWTNKTSAEGKKPSQIYKDLIENKEKYEQSRKEETTKSSPRKPGPAKRTRVGKVPSGMARLWGSGLRRVAKRPRTRL